MLVDKGQGNKRRVRTIDLLQEVVVETQQKLEQIEEVTQKVVLDETCDDKRACLLEQAWEAAHHEVVAIRALDEDYFHKVRKMTKEDRRQAIHQIVQDCHGLVIVYQKEVDPRLDAIYQSATIDELDSPAYLAAEKLMFLWSEAASGGYREVLERLRKRRIKPLALMG